MRRHFLHPQFRVSSINMKARQYNARYDYLFSVSSAVGGYMVATPLLALVEVAFSLSQ